MNVFPNSVHRHVYIWSIRKAYTVIRDCTAKMLECLPEFGESARIYLEYEYVDENQRIGRNRNADLVGQNPG